MASDTQLANNPLLNIADRRAEARGKRRIRVQQSVILSILGVLLILSFIPIVLMLFLSLKDNGQIYGQFWALPGPVRWENYAQGWERMRQYIVNSLLFSLTSVGFVVLLSSLSGYVFARHKFPGKEFLYLIILALLMVPNILTLIPAFVLINQLGLANTPWALILPWTSGGQVFGILLCRGFFATLPEELFDAGRIDGATEFKLYIRIALPLSWPILVTLAVIHLVNAYNDFLWPLLTITDSRYQVVAVGLTTFSTSAAGIVEWGPRMAAYTIATIPLIVVFLFGMRYYIQGLTSGAVKS